MVYHDKGSGNGCFRSLHFCFTHDQRTAAKRSRAGRRLPKDDAYNRSGRPRFEPFLYLQLHPGGIIMLPINNCVRGKRRRPFAPREPVAGVNRRRGLLLPLSEHPATSRRGAPPTARFESARKTGKPGGTAEFSVPGIRDRRIFYFNRTDLRRKKLPCWTST